MTPLSLLDSPLAPAHDSLRLRFLARGIDFSTHDVALFRLGIHLPKVS